MNDVARTGAMTAHGDQTVGNLATVMKEENVGSVVVVEDRRPVGIVTDRDLVVDVLEPRADPSSVTGEEVMTESPVTVAADAGVFEAIEALSNQEVRRLPVVDDEGAVAGIVTMDDFVVLLTEELYRLAHVVEAESPPY